MKMSQHEKNLLILVSFVLVAVLYYQFIFTPKQNEIATLEQELFNVQTRYDQVMENIATLEERKNQIIKVSAGITEETNGLYPTLIQEKIILALDELINESHIQATIGFSQVSAQAVEPFTGGTYVSPQSSLSELADEYHALTNPDSLEKDTTNNAKSSLSTSTSTAEVMSVSLTFTGTYENVKTFVDAIQT